MFDPVLEATQCLDFPADYVSGVVNKRVKEYHLTSSYISLDTTFEDADEPSKYLKSVIEKAEKSLAKGEAKFYSNKTRFLNALEK